MVKLQGVAKGSPTPHPLEGLPHGSLKAQSLQNAAAVEASERFGVLASVFWECGRSGGFYGNQERLSELQCVSLLHVSFLRSARTGHGVPMECIVRGTRWYRCPQFEPDVKVGSDLSTPLKMPSDLTLTASWNLLRV